MKFAGPLAPGVSDPGHEPINQKINHSINSWFLVLGLWCLGLGSYCFFDSPGAHMGVRQGGSRATFLGSLALIRSYNFVLKSLLFLIPFFFDFWSTLDPKMTPKIHKNPSKIDAKIPSDVELIFDRLLIDSGPTSMQS